ncbi:MAG: ImmA/IrrE family metallo-endopeptidase [Clostridia bacterium]|nr:ImmA/IrrE family metallo-endopeptidase [Clostridia bacterium]
MTAEYIYKFAKACEAVYGTRDPYEIFRQRNASIKRQAPEGLRGLICMVNRTVLVAVDSSLTDSAKMMTFAHLLGHAVLHRRKILAGKTFEEPDRYPEGCSEREADIFASELLISDEEILRLRDEGMNEAQVISSFGSMRELAQHKLFSMRSRGLSVGDDVCRADFLRRCDVELFF